jgi:hypothetical protein
MFSVAPRRCHIARDNVQMRSTSVLIAARGVRSARFESFKPRIGAVLADNRLAARHTDFRHHARRGILSEAASPPELRAASLPVVGPIALSLGLDFGHIGPLLRLAVPASAGAVIDLARGIDPDLTGPAGGCWRLRCLCCCRGGRCGAGCRRSPRLDAAMPTTCA